MKILEGNGKFIKCNRILFESVTGESFGCLIYGNLEINRICFNIYF